MRVGVLGASGIGWHHVRIFHQLGAHIPVILGSSPETVHNTVARIEQG